MSPVTVAALGLFLVFFIGDFIGVKGFSRRTRPRTMLWNVNLFFSWLWVLAIGLLLFEVPGSVLLTIVLALLWFMAQVRAHWIPYLIGAPEEYRREYGRIFRDLVCVLPRLNSRGVVPPLYQTVILVLILITIVTGFRALFQ
jgi:hypothetical protein